jgi:hypothetical protein
MRTDWRLVLMYGGFASEEMAARAAIREHEYGLRPSDRVYPDSPRPEELRKLRLGRVVRK